MLDNFLSSLKLPQKMISSRTGTISNGFSEHYGAIETACHYAGIQVPSCDFGAFWSHGCYGPWEIKIPGFLTMNYDNEIRQFWLYVGRQDEAQQLRLSGFQKTRAIGVPFVYAEEIKQPRLKNSLLILPTHAMPKMTFSDKSQFVHYVQQLEPYTKYFSTVLVCLHANCFDSGLWINEFRDAGIQSIAGADYKDANALPRIKTLFSTFEYVTTNGWGSHVAYSLACGAKLSIYGTQPTVTLEQMLKSDTCWARNPASAAALLDEEVAIDKRNYLRQFYVPPMEGISDSELGNYLIGNAHKLAPVEMRYLLHQAFGKTLSGRLSSLGKKILWRVKQVARKPRLSS